MNNRIWKWLVPAILIILLTAITLGTAGAEEKKLTPRIKFDRQYTLRRGGPSVSGATTGETCVQYNYTVSPGNTGAVKYRYIMTIDDDRRENAPVDTLYKSNITEDNHFTYTFYQPGTYILFVSLYDSDEQLIMVNDSEYIFTYPYISISEGTAANPLTNAVHTAANACQKSNDFDTAVAINDYLAEHITYDNTFTYYSPEAGLLNGTCVCNGYSRAFVLIATECGLDCRRVIGKGNGGNHAWNAIKINGKWYQVDATWNDSSDNARYRHIYMGLSNAVMGINHSGFEYPDGKTAAVCDSLDDNYFVHTGKWTDLINDNLITSIQSDLNATTGNNVTIVADFGTTAWLENLDGSRYNSPNNTSLLKINGNIVAWALGKQEWTRINGDVTTPMTGDFTYSYTSGSSKLTGEMTALNSSGTCGENLTWILNDSILTISGTGEMTDFATALDQPWVEFRSSITEVVISDGVESIGQNAFYNFDNMTVVTIPDSVVDLGPCSFSRCSKLTAITLPEGLTAIGDGAFIGCVKLESIMIPDSVTSMGIDTFNSCSALTEATISSGLLAIPDLAFDSCFSLATVTIPEGITEIKTQAFNNCGKLTTIYLPRSLSQIGYQAFRLCNGLASINYSGLKSNWDQIIIATGNDPLDNAALHTHYGIDHEWEAPTYSWTEDFSEATATRICSVDSTYCKETETVSSTPEITKEATCTTDGETTYKAVFDNEAFGTKTETVTDIPATGHHYTAEYEWADDGKSCEITLTCEKGDDMQTPEVVLTSAVKTPATCTTKGTTEYTATAIYDDQTYTDSKDVEDIPATGHHYTAEYTWSEDGKSCVITLTCGEGDDTQTPEVTVISAVKTPATCTAKGTTTYTATATYDGHTYTDSKDVEDIPATGHHYTTEYTWSEDGKSCVITLTCVEGDDTQTPEVTVTSTVKTPATCTAKGTTTYTATAVYDGQTYTESKDVEDIPAMGHDYTASYAWADDGKSCVITLTCEKGDDTQMPEVAMTSAVKTLATCTAKGTTTYTATATYEGETYKDSKDVEDIPATGVHTLTKRDKKDSTCTETGTEEYWECKECHTKFSDEDGSTVIDAPQVINLKDHTLDEHHDAVAATEQADGNTEYWVCSVCHHMFTDEAGTNEVTNVTIPKLSPSLPPAGNHSDTTGNYTINANGTATFNSPTKDQATVSIPVTVRVGSFDVPVTKIADKAFKGKKKLKTITIGANIKEIGTSAFEGCKKLKTVKGGENVEKIGDKAYKGCVALTKYTIGAKVNYIGKNAFNGCTKLKTITVKSELLTSSNVKSGAFKKISAKATFKVPKSKKKEYAKFLPKKGTKTVKVK